MEGKSDRCRWSWKYKELPESTKAVEIRLQFETQSAGRWSRGRRWGRLRQDVRWYFLSRIFRAVIALPRQAIQEIETALIGGKRQRGWLCGDCRCAIESISEKAEERKRKAVGLRAVCSWTVLDPFPDDQCELGLGSPWVFHWPSTASAHPTQRQGHHEEQSSNLPLGQ